MGPELALIAGIAGTLVSAAGAISSGIAQSNAADFNAQVARQNAVAAQQQAAQDAAVQASQSKQQLGAAAAAYGAAGVSLEGTPLDVLQSTAMAAEQDRQTILYKGNLRAAGYSSEAALQAARSSTAIASGAVSAAGTILGGGANLYDKFGESVNLG